MKLGFVGLGKMGSLMVSRLLSKGIDVVAYDVNRKNVSAAAKKGATGAKNLGELAGKLSAPRMVWLMVPHGAVDSVISELTSNLSRGDIIIDGGNSFYRDSMRRAALLARKGIHFLDVGVSGGISGAKAGLSIMAGGDKAAFGRAEKIFRTLAAKDGYAYVGKSGAGHFVKMVHNGIEYALLESYGEGYSLVQKSKLNIDLRKLTRVWRNGSVIRSWLLDLLQEAFDADPSLAKVSGVVCGGSTGEWTVKTAKELGVPVPMIERSLKERIRSRKKPDFASKVVAILRNKFGGHKVPRKGERC